MTFGMALVSRILTGEEPCLRKVQFDRLNPLPVTGNLIQCKMRHELLLSKVINGLEGEITVNKRVEKVIRGIKLVGKIDILHITSKMTVIEVKSGREKDSHHVQLWLYMGCFNSEIEGLLWYPERIYLYEGEDVPENLWNLVQLRVRPLLHDELLKPIKGSHCQYCGHESVCKIEKGGCKHD